MSETPENRKRRKLANRKRALEYLGGKCTSCGSENKLEFDHIDPNNKSFRITSRLPYSWIYLKKELDKCQLLCHKCHWEKTRKERKLNSLVHGTTNMYINGKCRCNDCKNAWRIYFVPKAKAMRIKATTVI